MILRVRMEGNNFISPSFSFLQFCQTAVLSLTGFKKHFLFCQNDNDDYDVITL